MKYFLSVLGMVMVIEGLPYFAFPEKIKNLLVIISETPSRKLRQLGFVLMFLGLGLVYLAQRTRLF